MSATFLSLVIQHFSETLISAGQCFVLFFLSVFLKHFIEMNLFSDKTYFIPLFDIYVEENIYFLRALAITDFYWCRFGYSSVLELHTCNI